MTYISLQNVPFYNNQMRTDDFKFNFSVKGIYDLRIQMISTSDLNKE